MIDSLPKKKKSYLVSQFVFGKFLELVSNLEKHLLSFFMQCEI